MTILQTIDKMNKINQLPAATDQPFNLKATSNLKANLKTKLITMPSNKELYFVNLNNYLQQHQFKNNKLHLNQFHNNEEYQKIVDNCLLYNRTQDQSEQNNDLKGTQRILKDNQRIQNESTESNGDSSNSCFNCFDRITEFVERRLNQQPIYNLIKCFIVLLTITQLCIFLLSIITYKNNEQEHFYPKHGDYFILGTNLANLNAILSTIFYLYSIIGEIWPLLTLMTTLQAFYSIIELLALLTEPIKVQNIYIVFILLTSLQTFSMLLFVVMLRIKKLKEAKLSRINLNVNYV